jgi:alkanesulfonate monooxygenase SsuD/methylene tetrahydromethanopterin reductase-like flavin-dependent oxidoreductase (luciferase family)
VLYKLWSSEEPFDFDGHYFQLRGAISQPTPIQKPRPAVMCASSSAVGKRFTAQYADLCFINFMEGDLADWTAQVNSYKDFARQEFSRELGVWTKAFVICRPTQREADEYFDYVASLADERGDPAQRSQQADKQTQIAEQVSKGYRSWLEDRGLGKLRRNPGWPGHPLIGTAEQITDGLARLSQAGVDGCMLFWVNYLEEQPQFIREVLPLMEQAGLRKPFSPR